MSRYLLTLKTQLALLPDPCALQILFFGPEVPLSDLEEGKVTVSPLQKPLSKSVPKQAFLQAGAGEVGRAGHVQAGH